jgi:hypothetical protein
LLDAFFHQPQSIRSQSKSSKVAERVELLLAGFLLGFSFYPEEGGSMFSRNVRTLYGTKRHITESSSAKFVAHRPTPVTVDLRVYPESAPCTL